MQKYTKVKLQEGRQTESESTWWPSHRAQLDSSKGDKSKAGLHLIGKEPLGKNLSSTACKTTA
jgi:hypothetical protein